MTESIDTAVQAPPATKPSRKRRLWVIAGVVLAAAVVATLAVVLLPGGGFTVHGTVTIGDTSTVTNPGSSGQPCSVVGSPNIEAGAPVVVTASNGETLALGHLGEPVRTQGQLLGDCSWPFTVTGVKAGRGPYGVQVGGGNKVVVTEADARKLLDLSFGG